MDSKHLLILLVIWTCVCCIFGNDTRSKDGYTSDTREKAEESIDDEYILSINHPSTRTQADLTGVLQQLENEYSLQVKSHVQLGDLLFVTIKGDATARGKAMKSMTNARYIELNGVVRAFGLLTGMMKTQEDNQTISCVTQDNLDSGLWGLARINQRTRQGNSISYSYGDTDNGQGVNVYVLDSGIDINHNEFEGRAIWGFSASNMGTDLDLNGHGTHVAGTIGSAEYGVAKNSTLIAVKVLNRLGVGTTSGILEGAYWIAQDYEARGSTKSVVNLSLGLNSVSTVFDEAIEHLISLGITAVVAAGNSHEDACASSPARIPDAITVGATDDYDVITTFSNYGECVDIFAPGQDILSTFIDGVDSTELSGTSMAAPHVAGIVARYLSTLDAARTPQEITEWVLKMSTKNAVSFRDDLEKSSPNRLAYMHCYTGDEWDYDNTKIGGAAMLRLNACLMHITLLIALFVIGTRSV